MPMWWSLKNSGHKGSEGFPGWPGTPCTLLYIDAQKVILPMTAQGKEDWKSHVWKFPGLCSLCILADFNWYAFTIINHNNEYNSFQNTVSPSELSKPRLILEAPQTYNWVRSEKNHVSCSHTAEAIGESLQIGSQVPVCTAVSRKLNNYILGSFMVIRRWTLKSKTVDSAFTHKSLLDLDPYSLELMNTDGPLSPICPLISINNVHEILPLKHLGVLSLASVVTVGGRLEGGGSTTLGKLPPVFMCLI